MNERDRRQNPRGQGRRLRGDIVAAATELLEESGSEDAITLRGVARRVGIAAPSIYGHFSDTDEILDAVIAEAFAELDRTLATAGGHADGPGHLEALCTAYLRFAVDRPHRYRVMFGRHRSGAGGQVNQPRPTEELSGADAFARLAGAVASRTGRGAEEGALADATALWVGLHGFVSLRTAVPAFPWPPDDAMLRLLVARLVGPAAPRSGPSAR